MALEKPKEEIEEIIKRNAKRRKAKRNRNNKNGRKLPNGKQKGILRIHISNNRQRAKPNLSNAALETLAIIAYNQE